MARSTTGMLLFLTFVVTSLLSVRAQTTGRKPGPSLTEGKSRQVKLAPCPDVTLNHKAVSKPEPDFPEEAKAAGASGSVGVYVKVDEEGKVYSAVACSGHPLLRQAAVDAAYRARLSRTFVAGKPVKVRGLLIYNFKRQ